jgi:uncharacterized SAM-binding protein YcdF (DUF218 family)
MKTLIWLLVIALVACFVYWLRRSLQRMEERRAAAEQRETSFLMEARGAGLAAKGATPGVQEQLLHDAATKAAAAGEPALSIQLYARLLSRFPQTTLAAQARAAVDVQKKKLSTATAPGPAAPG